MLLLLGQEGRDDNNMKISVPFLQLDAFEILVYFI